MTLLYTTVPRIFTSVPKLKELESLSSADITQFGEDAEAEVNARLSAAYAVPITDSVPLLGAIATDLTCYRILSRRIMNAERLKDSPWPDRFKEALKLIDDIVSGKVPLVNSAGNILTGSAIADTPWSTDMNYLPTMTELGSLEDRRDPDKIDDLATERE